MIRVNSDTQTLYDNTHCFFFCSILIVVTLMYITAYKQIAVCLGHLHKNGAFKSDISGNKVIAISGKECCSLF